MGIAPHLKAPYADVKPDEPFSHNPMRFGTIGHSTDVAMIEGCPDWLTVPFLYKAFRDAAALRILQATDSFVMAVQIGEYILAEG